MIGLVGPPDSVARCLAAARDLGVEQQVVARTYTHLGAVEELTAELDLACPVIVFTGVAPYTATRGKRPWIAHHDYIAHSAADLYQAMLSVVVADDASGRRFSVDGIGIPEIESMFVELPLPAPAVVEAADLDVPAIAAAHLKNLQTAKADCVLTCLSAIHEAVIAGGGTSLRIKQGVSTLKSAISAAVLQSQVRVSESTQIAVGIASLVGAYTAPSDEALQGALSAFADRLRGALVPVEHDRFAIYTTRGLLEESADRAALGQSSPFDELTPFEDQLVVSFGIATSIATAEVLAHRAAAFATAGTPSIMDGGDGSVTIVGVEEPGGVVERALPQIEIGPLSFRRLVRALQKLDPSATTSSELATAYGVTDRSARRLLKRLASIGVAVATDSSSDGARGRPKTIYRVDIDHLLSSSR